MAVVMSEMSMSLDGFVADPADQVGPLFDRYTNGDVEVPTADPERWAFRTSEASARYLRESMERIGALVAGWVGVAGPNVAQQCLEAGLLDEVRINLVPVLLGKGVRYFDSPSNAPVPLEDPRIIQATGVTHLIYRVGK